MNTTPIEFMAWDKKENRMWVASTNSMKPICAKGIDSLDKQASNRGYILLQRTALRSINDEPIYNHMIVKDEDGEHFIIDMWDYYGMHYLRSRQLEIVGNRFQHPEFLDLCK